MAVAHGCTGKGNDQVRFDVTFQTLAPHLKIIAPVREWKWTRTQELQYAATTGSRSRRPRRASSRPTRTSGAGRSRRGSSKTPGSSPRPRPSSGPSTPGRPRRARGGRDRVRPRPARSPSTASRLDGAELIEELNKIAGRHGVGRVDHIENRLVGIKSREIYEAPAAIVLHEAHREIEFLTLSKEALRFKTTSASNTPT